MSQPQQHDEVPDLGASALIVQGLAVGSGVPPTATSQPAPLDDADEFTITKPINATQLADELSTALQRAVLTALTNFTDGVLISEANPATLWVSPSGLDDQTIQTVISNHSPFAAYDIPKEDLAYSDVVRKVLEDKSVKLTSDEMQTAVRGLLLRVEGVSPAPTTSSFPSGVPST